MTNEEKLIEKPPWSLTTEMLDAGQQVVSRIHKEYGKDAINYKAKIAREVYYEMRAIELEKEAKQD